MTHYNNPPANLVMVDDEGHQTGMFEIGAAANVV